MHSHKVVLADIVAHPLARARKGLQNQNSERESHIETKGNEEANKLATAAIDPRKCSQKYAVCHEGLQGLYWPVEAVKKMNQEYNKAVKNGLAGDLTSALTKAACQNCQAGQANTTLHVKILN